MKRSLPSLHTLILTTGFVGFSLFAADPPESQPPPDPTNPPAEVVLQATPRHRAPTELPAVESTPRPAPYALEQPNSADQLRWAEDRAQLAERRAESVERLVTVILAICLLGLPAAFVSGVYFARYKNYQQLNQTLRGLLERGTNVPPELLTPPVAKGLAWSDLRKGIVLLWLGVGSGALLQVLFRGNAASLALIPMFIGGAYILLGLMDRKKAQH